VKKFLVLLLPLLSFLLCFSSTAHSTEQIKNNNHQPVSNIKICAVYPHLKDSYWLSINFGMTEQAKKRSIELKVLEAGGYENTDEQLRQIEQCINWQASAILVGSVNFEQLNQKLTQVNPKTPIFALVNEIATKNITGRTGVSWYQMGYKLGEYLAKNHRMLSNKQPAQLAWFPGPKSGGGSLQSTEGLRAALANSNIKIVTIQHGLNDKIVQFSLLKSTLKKYPNIDYLAGNAVMAEMAISEVAQLPKEQQPKILSHYLSHGVYRGIKRNKILMANSDQMALQGKMAINQAVDYLQTGKLKVEQVPEIISIDQNNISQFNAELSLSPSHFKPIYNVGTERIKTN
jgi:protein TorT